MGAVKEWFSNLGNLFANMNPIVDIIDILIVSVILYYAFMFVRERRAGKLAVGVVILLIALGISELSGMKAFSFIIENIMQVGLIALIIIFQPELRSVLEKVGGGVTNIGESKRKSDVVSWLDELTTACSDLSDSRTGALIVIERETRLGDEIRTGVPVNADINCALIKNIFFNKAPLHDGAMILRDGRIHSCGCFLPLSQNNSIDKNLGTRHRAALGLSEISDALVVVVSEETGTISVARNGKLKRDFDKYTLQNELVSLLDLDNRESGGRLKLRKNK
ncbi:MAG: diadenylate cyclase CdaA [Firmicutes bacterium]|nr:diadenylate cyclase CdaA [Bacillota bacterium]